MAKAVDAKDAATEEEKGGAGEGRTRQIHLDESKMATSYANFCRVTPGYEELIIDFGLSPQPIGPQPTESSVQLDQRVVVNYFMAKRLLGLLNGAVQRYESVFGVLETDVQKRVKSTGQASK